MTAQQELSAPVRGLDTSGIVARHDIADLRARFDRMHRASRSLPAPTYHERMKSLQTLLELLREHQDRIVEVIAEDFSARSPHETRIAEVFTLVSTIKHLRSHLAGWMKPRARGVALALQPARAHVQCQPLGVVGVISPWNYPVALALTPLATALAAGNRVLLKPSEVTPRTSALLAELLHGAFPRDQVAVVEGGTRIAQAFAELPFDHLLYTGSTRVGRMVMRAAAENLTPVTLELGGKSPAIIHGDYPVERAAARVAAGKWFNAGQTCIAPDYVQRNRLDETVRALVDITTKLYPSLADNPDQTAIVNQQHRERLLGYVADAVARGATKIEVNPRGEALATTRKLAPTILTGVTDDMIVMQEEIFGPVLPIVPYDTLADALAYVNERPRPLALYYFDTDRARTKRVLEATLSGGAAINETVLHATVDSLPFGGVGPSGMGAYHGIEGFETFSHKRAVFTQSRWNGAGLMAPPYTGFLDSMLRFLIG
jgi:coniferyl-aldehyde dehydrogenase